MKTSFDRTKIIATLGPSSNSYRVLEEMAKAGIDAFRINFSHGSHREHTQSINHVKEVNETCGTNVGVLADLQGPKIRVGEIEGGHMTLKMGDHVTVTTEPCLGTGKVIPVPYRDLPRYVSEKDRILIDDGKMELKVTGTDRKGSITARVITGGVLSSKKGVNLPHAKIPLPSLTQKDIDDLKFILKAGIDWVGLSFVRSARDIEELGRIIKRYGGRQRTVAKIEKPEALRNIDEIVSRADAVMVARGDLGVETPMEQVPIIQKDIVMRCIRSSKPVIIATQMMETMISNPVPTRAEVTDVANSVFDGADAVMLSGETSIGKHPVRVVETVRRIIKAVEQQKGACISPARSHTPSQDSGTFLSDEICYNACRIANELGASAIIGMTQSGYTAFKISSFRPDARIFIFTNNRFLLSTLNLVWGVKALYYDRFVSTDATIDEVKEILRNEGYVKSGDIVVNVASMPLREKGRSNMMKVSRIE